MAGAKVVRRMNVSTVHPTRARSVDARSVPNSYAWADRCHRVTSLEHANSDRPALLLQV
jgi:hypothetical protein